MVVVVELILVEAAWNTKLNTTTAKKRSECATFEVLVGAYDAGGLKVGGARAKTVAAFAAATARAVRHLTGFPVVAEGAARVGRHISLITAR